MELFRQLNWEIWDSGPIQGLGARILELRDSAIQSGNRGVGSGDQKIAKSRNPMEELEWSGKLGNRGGEIGIKTGRVRIRFGFGFRIRFGFGSIGFGCDSDLVDSDSISVGLDSDLVVTILIRFHSDSIGIRFGVTSYGIRFGICFGIQLGWDSVRIRTRTNLQ